jgi:hypothetical protein
LLLKSIIFTEAAEGHLVRVILDFIFNDFGIVCVLSFDFDRDLLFLEALAIVYGGRG